MIIFLLLLSIAIPVSTNGMIVQMHPSDMEFWATREMHRLTKTICGTYEIDTADIIPTTLTPLPQLGRTSQGLLLEIHSRMPMSASLHTPWGQVVLWHFKNTQNFIRIKHSLDQRNALQKEEEEDFVTTETYIRKKEKLDHKKLSQGLLKLLDCKPIEYPETDSFQRFSLQATTAFNMDPTIVHLKKLYEKRNSLIYKINHLYGETIPQPIIITTEIDEEEYMNLIGEWNSLENSLKIGPCIIS